MHTTPSCFPAFASCAHLFEPCTAWLASISWTNTCFQACRTKFLSCSSSREHIRHTKVLCESPPSCDIQLVSVTIQQGQVCGERCHCKTMKENLPSSKIHVSQISPLLCNSCCFQAHPDLSPAGLHLHTQFLQLYLPTICKCRVFNISMPAAFQSPIKTA